MRLIDADSLETHEIYEGEWKMVVYADDIDAAPTIEAEPEWKKGKWIKVGDNSYMCSVCGEVSCCNGNFCPDCGSKMTNDLISRQTAIDLAKEILSPPRMKENG